MPVFLGTLTLDEQIQPEPEALLKAGAQLLAEHDHAAKIDPAHDDHHAHLLVAGDGTVTADTSEHVCDHHSHAGENGLLESKQGPHTTTPKNPLQVEGTSGIVGKRIVTNQAIVLENAAHGFVRPNILDVKLGVRLYADDAKAEKKARFDKVTEETTHKKFGFRIAGMRVWHGEGATGEHVNQEGYRVYDKNYGRLKVNNDNIEDAFRNFLFSTTAGVDEALGTEVCKKFLEDVQKIEEVMYSQESEMFSASLLFVFEGDGKALQQALEESSKQQPTSAKLVKVSSDSDDEEDVDEGPFVYAVKVIDFAHAKWTPGKGRDENSLKGISSVADILAKIAGVERQPLSS